MLKDFVLRPFEDRDLRFAARLLEEHHRRHASPLSPELSPADTRAGVESAWAGGRSSGTIALREGRPAAYLFGDVVDDPFHGRSARVRWAGHARSADTDPDLMRDLYAAAAESWLEDGASDHRVIVAAADTATTAAFVALGFGSNQAYALRSLHPEPGPSGRTEVSIRRAVPGDGGVLADLANLIAEHQSKAPAWVPSPRAWLERLREGYAHLASDPSAVVHLAHRRDEVVGFALFLPMEPTSSEMPVPAACVELKVAATLPSARGTGVMRTLVAHGMAQAYADGFRVCGTDWHVPNLAASRVWPRMGFTPVAYRLRRRIDV